MNITFPTPFRFAISESRESLMHNKVGACIVVGKNVYHGHNQDKTHTVFANPNIHVRLSMHAEMVCLNEAPSVENGIVYVYREVHNQPAMARPCEQCIPVLRRAGVKKMCYSIPHYPFWAEEWL